jgi:hypothetical protein
MRFIFLLLVIAFMSVFSYTIGQPVFVKNSLQEINSCEGKIQLTLVRTWGGDEINDENQFFKFPRDVKVSQDGLIYIADSINNRIQVFDRKGNFKRSVGTAGQGPADLLQPSSLDLDKNNNLIVSDSGNLRIQAFDSRGNYLNSFRFDNKRPTSIAVTKKNEIVFYSFEKTFISGSLLYILDYKGKLLREIGNPPIRAKSIMENESLFFTLDSDDIIYISFYATPYYHKYSSNGESLLIVSYEIPIKGLEVNVDKPDSIKDVPRVSGKKELKISAGITVDHEKRVYLVAAVRPPNKNEKFFIGSGGRRYPKKIESENTDRYRLLVFNPSGRVIATKKLSVFCDKVYIHEDSLFIIDTYMAMKIYEYKVSFTE